MEHILITNQNSNVEVVDNNIIHKLAEEAQDCDASSNMTGNLQTTNAYEDDVDFLTTKFPGLNINVTSGMYIRFEDPAVLSTLITNNISSDGQGVTTTDALAVTNLNSLGLTNNSSITSFTELRQFKNITYAPGDFFSGCTNLEWIALPENNTNLGIGFQISGGKTLKWVVPNMEFACSRDFNAWYQHPGRGGGSDHVWTFYDLDKLPINDVVIPSGITTIGRYLFSKISCNSITFPSGIEEIKNNAFEDAQTTLLFTVDLSTATSIGLNAFYKCSSISGELHLPNITSIGKLSFSGASSISKVTCLNKVSTIPQAFMLKPFNTVTPSLTEVYLPYECTEIGRDAFSDCSNLTTIKQYTLSIDNWIEGLSPSFSHLFNIRILRNGCLANCNLTLTAQDLINLEIIELGALRGNTFSSSIDFPNLTELGSWAMSLAKEISSVDFTGSTFTVMPQETFGQVNTLTSVVLPTTCVELGNKAFYGNSNLLSVSNLNNVTKIGHLAFNGDNNLVILASDLNLNISHIGEYAFLNCNLTGDLILSNLSVIDGLALLGTKLTSVDFTGSTFTKTPRGLFLNVSTLDHVIFSTSVVETERWLFYNCTNLRYAVFPTTSTITWNNSTFENCPSTCTIYVDDSKVSEVTTALSGKFNGQIKGISEMPSA